MLFIGVKHKLPAFRKFELSWGINSDGAFFWDNSVKIAKIVLVLAAVYQLWALTKQIRDNHDQQSANFIIDFNNQLRGKDGYRQLVLDIADDDSTLFTKHYTAEEDKVQKVEILNLKKS